MSEVTIGSLKVTRIEAEAAVARAKRAGRRPPLAYELAIEKFRSFDLKKANEKPAVWVFK